MPTPAQDGGYAGELGLIYYGAALDLIRCSHDLRYEECAAHHAFWHGPDAEINRQMGPGWSMRCCCPGSLNRRAG